MKILISGASVAGPALAFWLGRAGHDITVVERAAGLRNGGYAVDFRGAAHLTVLKRMGLIETLRQFETGGTAMRFVDSRNRTRLLLPADFAGGDIEVRLADLTRVLHEHSRSLANYVFQDSVRSLEQFGDRVEVAFENAAPQSYHFVFGADGIHSNVRSLTFPDEKYDRDLGYYIASWAAPGLDSTFTETVCFNVPGRMIGIQPAGRDGSVSGVLALFASPTLDVGRHDRQCHKQVIRQVFDGLGWRTSELLATLDGADDVYFNTISRAELPYWSRGRVALLGDAAGGVSIGGMGTSSAIVAAYVLSGELQANPGDYVAAFERYQQRVEPYASVGARNGEGSGRFLAPRSSLGLAVRNRFLSIPVVKNSLIKMVHRTGANIHLPEYLS